MLTKSETALINSIIDLPSSPITHMKIQKLLYFSVGRFFVKTNNWAIDGDFEAWPHGPVLPALYYKLSRYADSVIKEFIPFEGTPYILGEKSSLIATVQETVNDFGKKNAWELSEISHDIKGPWFEAYHSESKSVIPRDKIKDYFLKSRI